MIPVKPGTRTTELYVTVIAGALISTGIIPKDLALELAIVVAGYALSRGAAKISPTADWTEDPHKTTPDDGLSPEERGAP